MRIKGSAPELILKEGKPVAVILDVDKYQEMLEKLEDIEDLKMLNTMRKKPLRFRKLANHFKD